MQREFIEPRGLILPLLFRDFYFLSFSLYFCSPLAMYAVFRVFFRPIFLFKRSCTRYWSSGAYTRFFKRIRISEFHVYIIRRFINPIRTDVLFSFFIPSCVNFSLSIFCMNVRLLVGETLCMPSQTEFNYVFMNDRTCTEQIVAIVWTISSRREPLLV